MPGLLEKGRTLGVGCQENIEWCTVQDLRIQLSCRSIADTHFNSGLVRELRRDLGRSPRKIAGYGNRDLAPGQRRPGYEYQEYKECASAHRRPLSGRKLSFPAPPILVQQGFGVTAGLVAPLEHERARGLESNACAIVVTHAFV